jgi:transcriptional regulator with XRE-family HTH domain
MNKLNQEEIEIKASRNKSSKRDSTIGVFIKTNRKARSLSQKQLASYAGVSFTFLNRVENGDIDIKVSTLNKVLAVFGHQIGPIPIAENKMFDFELPQEGG